MPPSVGQPLRRRPWALLLFITCNGAATAPEGRVASLVNQLFSIREPDRILAFGVATVSINGEANECGIEDQGRRRYIYGGFLWPAGDSYRIDQRSDLVRTGLSPVS